ncbi:heat-labile enterotoxin alpha chain-domain-containing protein [Cadophora sp. MPI-SDFR-AT-0126]|nr:heat-labile enterotoxin alpha chain-domain-containing protein [Leotiomycetes sp. MPI-SDFR-AT-0126]
MSQIGNLLVFYLLTLWASFCYGQTRVYRADTRGPEELRQVGGFMPRGLGGALQVAPNVSMYNHARGAANGQSTDSDGYVSTTITEARAIRFLEENLGGRGYVYTIAGARNFVQVSGTLGQYSPYVDEVEYAALGGFHWSRVIGWAQYQGSPSGPVQVGPFISNEDYDPTRYGNDAVNQGDPSLAGFPGGHPGWSLSPWNAFANGNCGRKLRLRQTNCNSASTAVALAQAFLDKECAGGACS